MVRNQLEPKGADDLHVVQRVVRAGCVDNGGSKQGSSYKELQKISQSCVRLNAFFFSPTHALFDATLA